MMFGHFPVGFTTLKKIDPKDIPEPTPLNLPRYQPFARSDALVEPEESLSSLLKHTGRSPTSFLGSKGLSALGVDLKLGAKPEQLVPDAAYVPDFSQWEQLTLDEAREKDQATRRPLRNGNLSPGCHTYIERQRELSNSNRDGYRTVRRIQPPKGVQHARLGNAYEFFRNLEAFTAYWDDPTQPPEAPPSPELDPVRASDAGSQETTEDSLGQEANADDGSRAVRTSAGHSMPHEYRQKILFAFIKLVAYDFGCNVGMARTEPRLHLTQDVRSPCPRKTYFPSACGFVHQAPTTRETARAGLTYGPVAAVSARSTTNFTSPDIETAQSQDLAREILAALITAQHRQREGKTEMRFGEGQWWTHRPRWGGGSGGPIGREIERDAVQGDKDERPSDPEGMPVAKKPRKNMSIYDNYRMVRPPAATWDKKARYEAIGQRRGAAYDDVFVFSSVFHHISVLRVRVPARLLKVLEGAADEMPAGEEAATRSWGSVQAWRSPWFDLFRAEERVEAMKYLWGVMAYQMRGESAETDVSMTDAQ